MSFYDLYSPIIRRKWSFLVITLLLALAGYQIVSMVVPDTQKTTLYFSVKPASNATNTESLTLDPLESSMKVAEMISGWAKDPSFRKMVIIKSKATISQFKKKISAKKQNRANVFWTLKLPKKEQIQQERLIAGVKESIESRLATFNQGNQYPFAITPIEEAIDYRVIPPSWRFSAALILALVVAYFMVFLFEMAQGKVSFTHQVRQIFPTSPLFYFKDENPDHGWDHFKSKTEIHEAIALSQTPPSEDFLSGLVFIPGGDTVLIYVVLGETNLQDLENLSAAYRSEKIGIVVRG